MVFYNLELLNHTTPVTLTAYNMPLTELLELVFRNQPVNFTIQEKTIILSPKEKDPAARLQLFEPSTKGQILDMDNQPLTNVSIRIRGTNRGTTSGAGGNFSLDVKEGEILEISAVGFSSLAIRLSGDQFRMVPWEQSSRRKQKDTAGNSKGSLILFPYKNSLMLQLSRSSSVLDEVVIIPYGKTSKRFATGSIGTVKASEIEKQPVMNVLQALEGKVPGMTITSLSGNSAARVKVEIRGRSSLNPSAIRDPLYIIDGIPLNMLEIGPMTQFGQVSTGLVQGGFTHTRGESALLFLNPRDVESVDVLKDADATAIYGSRGSNGVILITTKKGKTGPTRFNLTISNGFKAMPGKIPVMNTREYLSVRREALRNDGVEANRYNAPDLTIWDTTRNTDWQRELIGTGSSLDINATVSGGLAQTAYSISANFSTVKDIMNNGGKNIRTGFQLTLNHASPNQKFQVDAVSRLSLTDINSSTVPDVALQPPNAPAIYDKNGDFNFEPYRGEFYSLFPFTSLKTPSESQSVMVNNSLTLRYELIRGLTLSTTAGINFGQNRNATYGPLASLDPLYLPKSNAIYGNSNNTGWTVEPQLQYTTVSGKGNLSVQVGGSIQQTMVRSNTIIAYDFPNDNLLRSHNNASGVTNMDARGEYKYNGFFSIINFRWDNKYVINLSARRDGSSKFGPGNQFGNFGSIGLAWIASDENWLRDMLPDWFNFLKFRGSYGITGSDAVDNYGYIVRWSSQHDQSNGNRMWDYNGSPGFTIANSINPGYSWTSSKKLDIGTSIALFKDKLTLDIIWYRSRNGRQLTPIPTPVYTGFGNVTANWDAVVQNTGLEVSLSGSVLQTKDWSVRLNANISRNWDKLYSYPGFENSPYATNLVIGKPLSTVYLMHYTGINPLNGTYTFEDRNKDGQLYIGSGAVPISDHDDRYIEFNPALSYTGGLGINASYKNFGVYCFFIFKKKWAGDPYLLQSIGGMNNLPLPREIAENHWQKPGDQAKYPKYTAYTNLGNIQASDAAYVDASYLRMNSLSISYQLPEKWLQRIKMKGCTLSLNTQNLFTISSFKGIDPEIDGGMGVVPMSRSINTNLSINF